MRFACIGGGMLVVALLAATCSWRGTDSWLYWASIPVAGIAGAIAFIAWMDGRA